MNLRDAGMHTLTENFPIDQSVLVQHAPPRYCHERIMTPPNYRDKPGIKRGKKQENEAEPPANRPPPRERKTTKIKTGTGVYGRLKEQPEGRNEISVTP